MGEPTDAVHTGCTRYALARTIGHLPAVTRVSNLLQKQTGCTESVKKACVAKIHGGLRRMLLRPRYAAAPCQQGKKQRG